MTAYQKVLSERQEESIPKQEEDALSAQERINWITSNPTKKLIRELNDKAKSLEARARQLALEYPQHENHLRIIQLLIEADTYYKLIEQYCKLKT